MRPVPFNDYEAIICRFWDENRSQFDQWQFSCDPETRGKVQQIWCGIVFEWIRGNQKTVGRFERGMEVDLRGYTHLRFCASAPSTTHFRLVTVIDGREQINIPDARGTNVFMEYEGAFEGDSLSFMRLEIVDDGTSPGNVMVQWLGVTDHARKAVIDSLPYPYKDNDWDDLWLPAGSRVEMAPRLGLFFGAEDLPGLRKRVSSKAYSGLMDQLRAIAYTHYNDQPWLDTGKYIHGSSVRCSPGAMTSKIDPLAMRLCAFVGLIDEDEAMLRMALYHALAAAHCEYWNHEFACYIPGTTWEHRAFDEYRTATNLVFAWDWAGSYLTAAGEQVFAQALVHKALPAIELTLLKHAYQRHSNQGCYFTYGAAICQLALARVYPYGGEGIDLTLKRMAEVAEGYIYSDGGSPEGPAYLISAVGHLMVAYEGISRYRGVPLTSIVPERVQKVVNYVRSMSSTIPPIGTSLPVSDGGRIGKTLYPDGLASLYRISRDPIIGSLFTSSLGWNIQESEYYSVPGNVFSIILGPQPEHLPPMNEVQPDTFSLLPATGMVCSCRETPDGAIRMQFLGATANTDHGHNDRGSFIIEAFQEAIAIDCGMCNYSDPRATQLKKARYHNMLTPDMPDGEPMEMDNPSSYEAIPEGEGDEQHLHCSIDNTRLWEGEIVRRSTRRIDSDDPTCFIITDELDLEEDRTVTFHVQSNYPWIMVNNAYETHGVRAILGVEPQWQPYQVETGETIIDGEMRPVYTLRLRNAASRSHRLQTLLKVRAVK